MRIPFNGPSYKLASPNQSAQRCVNWYLEATEKGGKTGSTLLPTPGLRLLATVGSGPIRSMLSFGDMLYVVSGYAVYRVDSAFTSTLLGTIDTASGKVGMACNGTQILLVDGLHGYYVSIGLDAVTRIETNTLTALTWSSTDGGTVTATTQHPHGVAVGDSFTVSDCAPVAYNGQWSAAAGSTGSTLVWLLPSSSTPGDITTLGSIAADGFPDGATWCTTVDGYFIVGGDGSQRFHISGINDVTYWNALDYASAEGDPDPLVAGIVTQRELVLLGSNSCEFWYDTGNGTFPFQRSGNAFMETGCIAPASVAKLDNTIFWLGKDARGDGMVWRADAYRPMRISDHGVEQAILGYGVIDDAVAFTYQLAGHSFYVLTFPTADATWVYDCATQCWHEWLWFEQKTGMYHRHRSNCHAMFGRDHITGDWSNGNLYALDPSVYTDIDSVVTALSCAFPLDDTGALAGRFGYGHLPMITPGLQSYSYVLTDAATGYAAIGIAANALTTANFPLTGATQVVEWVCSAFPSGNYDGMGPALTWNGTSFTFFRLQRSGGVLQAVNAGGSPVAVPGGVAMGTVITVYVTPAGVIGWMLNGVDQGLTTHTIGATQKFSPYVFVNDGPASGNIGQTVAGSLRTSSSDIQFSPAAGCVDICGNTLGTSSGTAFGASPIRRLRITQGQDSENNRVFYQSIEIDVQVGVGLTSGQGSDPKLMLRWSDDGGHTWSNTKYLSLGKIGAFLTRVKREQLGAGRNRIWELSCTDPVFVAVMGAIARLIGSSA